MRVLYIYDGDWPRGATRVRKQTIALARAGHEVLLVSRNDTRQARTQREDWMEIRRLPSFRGGAVHRLLNFPFFLNPVWISVLHEEARRWRADALLVEDLPLAPTALWVGRRLGIPVFYDMGEVYPEFLKGLWTFGKPSFFDRFIRNPRAAELLERYVLRRAVHTFVVSHESRRRAIERGADPNRLTIVGNTPEDYRRLSEPRPAPEDLSGLIGRPMALFTGILIFDRGIHTAIHAMKLVLRRVPDAVFVIVGDGPDSPSLRQTIHDLQLGEHVQMLGWKEHSELPGYYQSADVGLLPFLDGGQIGYTLANKLFDYMAAGLPVVASDVPPMRRVIDETGAGVLATPGSPEALANAIAGVMTMDAGARRAMGRRGIDAVAQTYNWQLDEGRFLSVFADHPSEQAGV